MTSKVLGSWPPEHGAVQAVAPHVEHLLAPNPSSWTYEGTNSYVIAHGGASVLIDPAVTDATHLDALRRRGQHDGRQVSAILLTHDHPDHSDGARELAELVDAPIVCFSPRFADEQPAHEQLIDLDGLPIHVLHTPGHSDDSLCLWIPENDVLITGDTLLGKRSAGVMGSLGELFTSIAMLLATSSARGRSPRCPATAPTSTMSPDPWLGSRACAPAASTRCGRTSPTATPRSRR